MKNKFTFKPLTTTDLDLLCRWFEKPHVLEWWNDRLTPEQIKEKYGKRIGDNVVCPYIVYLNDKPIALIQYYWASKVGDGWWPNEDASTVGVDQFIGEEDYINKGFGTLMMKEFIQFLFQNPLIKKIITEADPNNLRAKRCYEKAGFQETDVIDTPDGKSILMVITKKNEPPAITETLVHNLIATQFPQWKNLPIRPVIHQGWDNRTFHLGEHMLVRLPSHAHYAAQVAKEQHWLPKLAPLLPLSIPVPLKMGKPIKDYPWHWSIYRYLPGEPAAFTPIDDLNNFATSLAQFLIALQHIDTTGAPLAGEHSFYRGGALTIYDAETRQAIESLKGKIDKTIVTEIWETAIATTWHKPLVWIHGDISAGNLLVRNGKLSAVIDFGQLAVGDPACDLAIAWTFFNETSREVFRKTLSLDEDTWIRGRGWALWKALITAAGFTDPNNFEALKCLTIINEIITEYKGRNE